MKEGQSRPSIGAGEWTTIITPRYPWFDFRLRELWGYRDLISLFVRRDFVAQYKQTVLGPAWHVVNPILTTLMFTVVFGKIVGIATDGIPPFLFYLSGITVWNYFARSLTATSTTFVSNASLFGKVYFPRMAIPIGILISHLVAFGIQFVVFLIVLGYYYVHGAAIALSWWILAFPFMLFVIALLGLGCGILASSFTTRYRDLGQVVAFVVPLLMYTTPVIYPLSAVPEGLRLFVLANPLTPIIEGVRFAFLGHGSVNLVHLLYSSTFAAAVLFVGAALFGRVERTFIDTV